MLIWSVKLFNWIYGKIFTGDLKIDDFYYFRQVRQLDFGDEFVAKRTLKQRCIVPRVRVLYSYICQDCHMYNIPQFIRLAEESKFQR